MTTHKELPPQREILNADLYEPDPVTQDTVSLNVRMPTGLRAEFTALCASRNTEVSKVIRRFIEREVAAAKAAK